MRDVPIVTRPSPVKRWPGEVDLPAYLHTDDVLTWMAAINEANALKAKAVEADGTFSVEQALAYNAAYERGICAIVRGWRLKGLPESIVAENFPQTPPKAATALRNWLTAEIARLFDDEEEIPNG